MGKWIYDEDRINHWHCSECGHTISVLGILEDDYCPHCGSHMNRREAMDKWAEIYGYDQKEIKQQKKEENC